MTTPEIYQMCFQYSMTAKLAPLWNVLGSNILVNDRHFLKSTSPVEGIKYRVSINDFWITITAKPIKINLTRADNNFKPGEFVKVLPSLNKAVVEECCDAMPQCGLFKSYKDLRRHWKNIHGYRLPEKDDESSYCLVRFWRGDLFTYPKLCMVRNFPIVIPIPKSEEKEVLRKFLNSLKVKMANVLGLPLSIHYNFTSSHNINDTLYDTQAVSLCTPTQMPTQKQ